MIFSVVYLLVRRLLGCLVVLARREVSKDAELLVLRHENAVLQLVLGHALLTTTQLYLTPRKEEVIRRVRAHHGEQARQAQQRGRPAPAPGYRRESLDVLFGTGAP